MQELNLPDLDIDLPAFDLGNDFDLGGAFSFETRYLKPKVPKKMPERMILAENAIALANEIKIERGMRVHCIVSGDFIFGDFLESVLTTARIKAKRVVISTLSISQHNVDSLRALIDNGYIERLDLLVSVFFFGHNRKTLIPYIYEKLDNAGIPFQLAVSDSHIKCSTIETQQGAGIVIHGSANMRSSNCIEQLCIEESRELLDFHNGVADLIIEEYATIDGPVRQDKQWSVINAGKAS